YKGQVVYAHIIRRANPGLGMMKTTKGYSPDDLISTAGKLRILRAYLSKRLTRKDWRYDPNGVHGAWSLNRSFYEGLALDDALFDIEKVSADKTGRLTDARAKLYSLVFADNYLKNS
ncbi:MAG: hypothetical protein IH591_07760, partial [Bacteroidales bacterium]|nr:hypothetical protein [Bacteroidales bacterium]